MSDLSGYDITSPNNEKVKWIVRLRQRRHRDEARAFAVEEERIVQRALEAGYQPLEVYVCPDLVEPIDGQPYRTMSREAMDKASYRQSSTGLIAIFPFFERALEQIPITSTSLILVAEGMEKPGNLGALLRVADGAGVAGLVLVDSTTDVFNPNSVRASTGALFTVPLARSSLGETAAWLGRAGARSVAADPRSASPLWAADLTGCCAIWVGSEADGLTSQARGFADEVVAIPMAGRADSLNSSVAAAVLLYESVRQRSQLQRS